MLATGSPVNRVKGEVEVIISNVNLSSLLFVTHTHVQHRLP